MKMKKLLANSYFHALAIGLLMLACFGRVLASYFLADDFGEILYVSKIFNGDLNLLWSNFTGNYMQIPSMAVYRPWLLMSLVIDFGIWQTNAFGYYFTNMLHYFVCGLFIYLLIKKLTSYWGPLRSSLASLSAALIFVANPLHCESLSWVVGRVDIVCLAFFLIGLYLIPFYMDSGKKKFLAGSLIAFGFAIFTKEMAIGLPVMAVVLAFIHNKRMDKTTDSTGNELPEAISGMQSNTKDNEAFAESPNTLLQPEAIRAPVAVMHNELKNFPLEKHPITDLAPVAQIKQRIKQASPVFLAFFVTSIAYFALRYATLGTFTGGYTGSIGASQLANIFAKWLDTDSLFRILYPFNYMQMGDGGIYRALLTASYFLTASLMVSRALFGIWPKRLLLLLGAWLLTALLPIYQLYGLGYNLEGMRFLFFATAPLSILMPVILFAPWHKSNDLEGKSRTEKFEKKALFASILAVVLLIFVFTRASYKNNAPWIEAGKQTRAVTRQIQSLANSLDTNKKIGVLGIPKDRAGAHMILNSPTLSFTLNPPFFDTYQSHKIVSFEPMLFANSDSINLYHFKKSLRDKEIAKFMIWDFEHRNFIDLPLDAANNTAPAIAINIPRLVLSNKVTNLLPCSNEPGYKTTATESGGPVIFKNASTGLNFQVAPLNIKPVDYDYLAIETDNKSAQNLSGKKVKLSWSGDSVLNKNQSDIHSFSFPDYPAGKDSSGKIFIPLSTYWQWFSFEKIENIHLALPPFNSLSITGAKIISASEIEPEIKIESQNNSQIGAYPVSGQKALSLSIKPITDAQLIELEIGKSNFFFENLSKNNYENAIAKVVKISPDKPFVTLKRTDFTENGYAQIRARCLSNQGDIIGAYSQVVTLEISD